MKSLKLFLINGITLALTSVALRFVDVSFNAYISRNVGTEGMGILQLIMSAYLVWVNVAVSGIGLATTRLVAEEAAKGNEAGVKTAVRKCLLYASFFGTGAFFLMYRFAPFIAVNFLKVAEGILPLRIFAFTLPFIALSAVFDGYFMAARSAAKAASGHMVERIFRVITVTYFLSNFTQVNLGFPYTAIALGAVISEGLSCLWLVFLYLLDRNKYRNLRKGEHITGRMFGIALPVALSSYLRSGLSGLKHMMIPLWLARSGMGSRSALEGYGVVHGMAMPVIMFPAALVGAFATLVVPETARLYARKDRDGINRAVSAVFRTTLAFAVCIAGVLIFWSDEIAIAVYKKAEVGMYLKILAPLVTIMYFDEVADSLLKGINKQVAVVRINIIDTLACIFLIIVLLPRFGMKGYIIMVYISELLNGFLSIGCILRNTDCVINITQWFIKPVVNIVIACYTASVLPLPHFSFEIITASLFYLLLTGGTSVLGKKKALYFVT